VAYKQSDCKFYKESVTYAIKSHQALCEVTSLSVKLELLNQCVQKIFTGITADASSNVFFLNAREHYPFLLKNLLESIVIKETHDFKNDAKGAEVLISLAKPLLQNSPDFNTAKPILHLALQAGKFRERSISFLWRPTRMNHATVLFLLLLVTHANEPENIFCRMLCSPLSALIQWDLLMTIQQDDTSGDRSCPYYFLSRFMIEEKTRSSDFESYLNYLKKGEAHVEHVSNFSNLVKTLPLERMFYSSAEFPLDDKYIPECQKIAEGFCSFLLGIGSLLEKFFPRPLIDIMSDYVSLDGSPTIFFRDGSKKGIYPLFFCLGGSENKLAPAQASSPTP
jgi:hypothetical protein